MDRIEFAVIKRIVDVFGALVGLFLFAPVIALFALIVYRESPGAVFFHQERAGRGGKMFKMLKKYVKIIRNNYAYDTKKLDWVLISFT